MRMSTGFSPPASTVTSSWPSPGEGSSKVPGSGTAPWAGRTAARMARTLRCCARMDDAGIAYDERGLVPCVIQDWATGEVLTLAWTNAEALARTRATGELHLWSRIPRRAVAQGRDVRQRPEGARHPLRLRRRRAARPRRAGRAGLPHGRAHVLPPRRARAARAARGAPGAGADGRRARRGAPRRAPTPPPCWPTRRRSARRWRRRPRRSPAPRARRRTSAWPRRPPTCSTTSCVLLRSRGLALADAEVVLGGRRR